MDPTPPNAVDPTCADAVAALFTYLDGALSDDRRSLIRTHLDACAPCFDAYEFHVELKMVIQQRCHTELPLGLKERIFRQVFDAGGPLDSGAGA